MLSSILWLLVGGTLLYFGAEGLVRGAVGLAFRAGMTPLVVGLTVVAAGTSAPEMVVSVLSGARGQGDIAIGNVVGSNICNILLIGGLAALIRPINVEHTVVRREIPLMIGVTLLASGFLWWDQGLRRPEAAILFALLIIITFWSIRAARRENVVAAVDVPPPSASLLASLALLAGGLTLLVLGADRFVIAAVDLARMLGISEVVIGLTIVAIGTSLPELATSVVAAARGESDIALGNVVGSNIFNLLAILGIAGLVRPLSLAPGTGPNLVVMVAVAVIVLPIAGWRFRMHRWEGALLLALYAGYLWWLVLRG